MNLVDYYHALSRNSMLALIDLVGEDAFRPNYLQAWIYIVNDPTRIAHRESRRQDFFYFRQRIEELLLEHPPDGLALALSLGDAIQSAWAWVWLGGNIAVAAVDLLEDGVIGELIPRPQPPVSRIDALWLQLGANANQGIHVNLPSINTRTLGGTHGDLRTLINVINPNGSEISRQLNYIDSASTYVAKERAKLGAVQNRLEHTARSLLISSENLQDEESRIRNADMASEKKNFIKANLLQQAGISMLAHANQNTQSVLHLLR
jgi:flagellin